MAEKTTALTPAEWQKLCLANLEWLHAAIQKKSADYPQNILTPEDLAEMTSGIGRVQSFLRAWSLSGPVVPQPYKDISKSVEGAPVKKKPGWPKGKKRTRLNPQVVQQ